jgi:hypothetical protein
MLYLDKNLATLVAGEFLSSSSALFRAKAKSSILCQKAFAQLMLALSKKYLPAYLPLYLPPHC